MADTHATADPIGDSAQTNKTGDANSYDAIPYRDFPYSHSHVRHLETLGTLFSMKPPPIGNCRVLELGCAAGGNLLPQAVDFPGSQFLGVDLSERQIEDGQRLLGEMNLPNAALRRANIMDIDAGWGQFDYIIAHGVFSWVPPVVQKKLIEVCSRNLAPNGIAYVSYNIYPGWRLAAVVRDLMQYHAGPQPDPHKRIEQAKAVLELLVSLEIQGAMGILLKNELDGLRKANNDTYLFHEHLEDENNPVYFHEFVKLAETNGLQYLADAEFSTMLLQGVHEKAINALRGLPLVQQEQYLDFIRGRRFRKTLLCHQSVPLQRQITSDRMLPFSFAIEGPCEAENVDIRNESVAQFKREGATLRTSQRLVKTAIVYLLENKSRFVSFRDLYRTAFARVQASNPLPPNHPALTEKVLAEAMLTSFSVGMTTACLNPPKWTTKLSRRPVASPLARIQAARGGPITNRSHQSVALNGVCQRLIYRLDGQHDRDSLLATVDESVRRGEVQVTRNNQPATDLSREEMQAVLDQTLRQIADAALLSE